MGNTLALVAARLVIGLVTAMFVSACSPAPQSPTTPTTPPATPPGTVTLSGIVSERISGRPIEGVRVWAYNKEVASDAAGRYRISGIPPSDQSFGVFATKPEYWQQCWVTVRLTADITLDLTLTSRANLGAANSQPPPRAPGTRSISGVVFEMTADGRQPVADVGVFVEYWRGRAVFGGDVVAGTLTDATGRYLLCGLPEELVGGEGLYVFALKNGYGQEGFDVGPGSDAVIDIEIKRR